MSVIESVRAQFAELQADRRAEPEWLSASRRAALERFLDAGLPTSSDEEWRFCSLAPFKRHDFRLASGNGSAVKPAKIASLAMGDWAGSRLVFVNGRLSRRLSRLDGLPEGAVLQGLSEALAEDGPAKAVLESMGEGVGSGSGTAFSALNEALFGDGAFLLVPKGVVLEEPVQLLFLSQAGGTATPSVPMMMHPKNVILAEAGAELKLVESYVGDGLYFNNSVTRVVVGENARVDHLKLQQESPSAFHFANITFDQARHATLANHSISLGARLARNDIETRLSGEGADCTLNGLYVVTGDQLVDHHTVIDHAEPHCHSRELYKGVLDGKARGVFNGRIIVRPDAQKTNAQQTNKNLLLSDEALVNSNPQLEIHADDVRCAHGATIGQLSEEALFYLRSRGIDRETARRLLTRGFISDVIGRIAIEAIRGELESNLFTELPRRAVGEAQ